MDLEEPDLPERSCIVTRIVKEPDALIRFVAAPDGRLVPDLKMKLPGRGCWVSLNRTRLEEAIKRKLFARALRAQVDVAGDLPDLVDRLLAADALAMLAMANKAGLVIAGFNKVESALASGNVAAILAAEDGAEDGKRKILQVLRRVTEDSQEQGPITLFSSAQLSLCLGRENVIHAALLVAPLARSFVTKCLRLSTYRQSHVSEAGHGPEP